MTSAPHPRLLFVCVENACRSQMAEGFARAAGVPSAASAGSRPAAEVDPRTIRLMAERGIDVSEHRPRGLEGLPGEGPWDYVVTMGCGDACPHLSARHRLDWQLPDPKPLRDDEFRAVRDEIGRRVAALVREARGPRPAAGGGDQPGSSASSTSGSPDREPPR